jgi:hypothetical protein
MSCSGLSLYKYIGLHNELMSDFNLTSSIHMSLMDSLGLFIVICGHGWSNNGIKKEFKNSSETIS